MPRSRALATPDRVLGPFVLFFTNSEAAPCRSCGGVHAGSGSSTTTPAGSPLRVSASRSTTARSRPRRAAVASSTLTAPRSWSCHDSREQPLRRHQIALRLRKATRRGGEVRRRLHHCRGLRRRPDDDLASLGGQHDRQTLSDCIGHGGRVGVVVDDDVRHRDEPVRHLDDRKHLRASRVLDRHGLRGGAHRDHLSGCARGSATRGRVVGESPPQDHVPVRQIPRCREVAFAQRARGSRASRVTR